MSDTQAKDLEDFLKVLHNAASKASVEYSDGAWADLSYTLSYISTISLAGAKVSTSLALEEVRSLVVPEDVVKSVLEEIEDQADIGGGGGHYL